MSSDALFLPVLHCCSHLPLRSSYSSHCLPRAQPQPMNSATSQLGTSKRLHMKCVRLPERLSCVNVLLGVLTDQTLLGSCFQTEVQVPWVLVKFSLHSLTLGKRTQGMGHSTHLMWIFHREGVCKHHGGLGSAIPRHGQGCLCLGETRGLTVPLLQESLRQYVDRIFTVITKSGVSCPTVMCDIFFSLREAAAKRFQGEPAWLS